MHKNRYSIKFNIATFSFTVVLIINLYYLYLIDAHYDQVVGIPAQDFALVVAMIWGGYYWFKFIRYPNPIFRYGKWMISFLALVILSSIQSNLLYGQGLLQGIAPQRWVFIWSMLYFPIRKLVYYRKIKFDVLIKILVVIGLIQLFLFILQFFVGAGNSFLKVTMGMRNGRIRYYFSPILLDLIFLYMLDRLNKERLLKKIFSILICGLILFETMVVQQFRLTSMGLILCFGLYILFVRNRTQTKIIYFVIGAIVLGFLYSTSIVQNVINTVATGHYDGGMLIRNAGRALYFATLFKHPLLGGGYPNDKYYLATHAAGQDSLIYLYDNGVFGFMYIYGIIGIIWLVSLWIKLLKDGWCVQKERKQLMYILFPVFFIITCMNELHWYWEYGMVVFSLFICLIDEKISEDLPKKLRGEE